MTMRVVQLNRLLVNHHQHTLIPTTELCLPYKIEPGSEQYTVISADTATCYS